MSAPRILVVDDESTLRLTLAANLELEGYEVTEAAGGEEALRMIAAESFDLVLSDIRMPGINGVDLFLQIKTLRPGLPVILMSAFAVEHLVTRAIQEGVFTVITKPFSVEAMAALLARAARAPFVLVVDGSGDDANATAEALRTRGIRARPAFDGKSAVALVREGNVDVCVVDLGLPNGTGPTTAREILEIDSSIAVIAVSGPSSAELLAQAAESGARAYLQKPFETPELLRTIAHVRKDTAK